MPHSVTPIHTPKPSMRLQVLLVMMRQQQQTYGRRDPRKVAS